MKLKVGDKVMWVRPRSIAVIREITEVRDTGYTWRYPGIERADLSNTFISENSNDPFFDSEFWVKL